MTNGRIRSALALAIGIIALSAIPAAAATGDIRSVTPEPGKLTLSFAVLDLPAESPVDEAGVRVRVDGIDVPAHVNVVRSDRTSAQTPAVQRSVMLLIDTSGSMKGEGIDGAKAAAARYVSTLPNDVSIGLAAFSDTAHVVVPPSKDRKRVSAELARLQARGETALYDGINVSLRALGGTGQRRVVLLSDGVDSASRAKAGPTLTAIRKSGIGVDAVAFQTGDSEQLGRQLADITRAGRGRLYHAGDSVAVMSALAAVARSFDSELEISVDVPARMAGRQASVRVDVEVAGEVLSDTRVVQLARIATTDATSSAGIPEHSGAQVLETASGPLRANTLRNILAPLALLFSGLLGLFILITYETSDRRGVSAGARRSLALYTLSKAPGQIPDPGGNALGDTVIARSAVELAGRFVRKRGIEERLALRLDRAGFKLRASEWVVLEFLTGLSTAVVLCLFLPNILIAALVGLCIGAAVPALVLGFKAGRRKKAFEEGLPDSLQLVAGSLSAGYSLPQALDAVVREGAEPVAGEIGRALAATRLGVTVEDALEHVAARMASRDFEWLVMAIRVQREVGGNLAEVLTTVGETIRDRGKLHRQVRALSAEGRLSAYILTGLPIFVAALLMLIQPDYLRPLATETLGRMMLLGAVTLVTCGALMMKKLITVEV